MLITVTAKKTFTIKDELLNTVNGLCYEVNDNCLDDLKAAVRHLSVKQARDVAYGINYARLYDHASTYAELLCESLGVDYEAL